MGGVARVLARALSSLANALNALADPGAAAPLWLQAAKIARQARDPHRLYDAFTGDAQRRVVGAGQLEHVGSLPVGR